MAENDWGWEGVKGETISYVLEETRFVFYLVFEPYFTIKIRIITFFGLHKNFIRPLN